MTHSTSGKYRHQEPNLWIDPNSDRDFNPDTFHTATATDLS